ncbi:hypothetical protein BC828DRAFT_80882 [Blastocladiella britannica]|nr:hypothetical protein BC828DRAFT_80882 [Blastocladiella britannica]
MHTSIVVMLAALACLAKASPVSLLDTAAANNGTASPQWDELACSEASLGAGYRGSVYRRDRTSDTGAIYIFSKETRLGWKTMISLSTTPPVQDRTT